jgi:dipeptidyl aminopeptidase/acylaminoacyl peptidase
MIPFVFFDDNQQLTRLLRRVFMRGLIWGARGLAAALLLTMCLPREARSQEAASPSPIPADALVDIGSVLSGRDAPQWHPDGTTIGAMSTLLGGLGFVGLDVESGALRPLVDDLTLVGTGTPGSQKPQFSPDGRYVAYVSSKEGPANGSGSADLTTGGDAPEIWLRDLDAGTDQQLTALGSRINALRWSPDSETILFTSDRYGSQDVWTVDVASGQATRLTADPLYEVYPDWHPSGDEIVYVRMDETWADHTVLEMPADGGAARIVVRDTDFFDYRAGLSFGTALVSPDGEYVLFRSLRSGWHNYWIVPRPGSDGPGTPIQIAPAEADQTHARWSPSGDRVLFLENHNGTIDVRAVRIEEGQPVGDATVVASPASLLGTGSDDTGENEAMGEIEGPAWSPDGTRIALSLSTPTRPADLYVVDVTSGTATRLTHSVPDAAVARLRPPEKVVFESTDGFTIHAYLHRPEGAADGTAPGIIWAHGGPTSQFGDNFGSHHQVHYFVQQGYAVLMPNVRGSSGYGKAFEDANNDCWGRCDLHDVRAGVDFLKTLPEVNDAKMGITGTSYGGILSMAAVAFAPGLFQAAIPISGYSDWVGFHDWNDELQHVQLLAYEFGPFPDSTAVYRRNSSIYRVADVTTPTLLLHGTDESTIPWRPAQKPVPAAVDFARALDQQYKIYRHRAYTAGSYYVYGRDNTIQKLRDMNVFFDQFLRDHVVDRSARHSAPE